MDFSYKLDMMDDDCDIHGNFIERPICINARHNEGGFYEFVYKDGTLNVSIKLKNKKKELIARILDPINFYGFTISTEKELSLFVGHFLSGLELGISCVKSVLDSEDVWETTTVLKRIEEEYPPLAVYNSNSK